MKRLGFTLAELLITAVVMAILGTLLARMLVQDSRFVSRVEAMMSARQTARAAATAVAADLRMVSKFGLLDASDSLLFYRLPVAWGMACGRNGGNVIASLIPSDSMMMMSHPISQIAWMDSTGTMQYFDANATFVSSPRAECTADSIRSLTGGLSLDIAPATPLPAAAIPSGSIMYAHTDIALYIRPSTQHPGRLALVRIIEGWNHSPIIEELISPMDSATHYEFLLTPNGAPVRNPPPPFSNIDAIELVFIGESVETPRDATEPEKFEIRTRIALIN